MKFKFYHLYFISALVFLYFSFLINGSIDIVNHDTYYVIAHSHVLLLICLILLIFGIIEKVFILINKPLKKYLTKIHFFGTILSILLSIMLYYWHSKASLNKVFKDYSVFNEIAEQQAETASNSILLLSLLILFISFQFIFLVNVLLVTFTKSKSHE